MRRVAAVALAMAAGAAVGEVLYTRLVAGLPEVTRPPALVWLAVTSPFWVTGLASGMCLTSWREVAFSALLAAIVFQSYETWAIKASLLFWTVGIVFVAAEAGGVLAAGRLIRLGTQRLALRRSKGP